MTSAMRSRRSLVTAVAVVASLLMGATLAAATPFSDVSDNSVHAPGVTYVADAGITTGCGDGSVYCPGDFVRRDQMATFLHRLSGNAPGVDPSVNAHRLEGFSAAELMAGGEQGPQGEPGPQGPKGDPGEPGTAGGLQTVELVSDSNQVQNEAVNQASVACPDGMMATGGGGTFSSGDEWVLRISTPFAEGWTVSFITLDGNPSSSNVTVRALCVPVAE